MRFLPTRVHGVIDYIWGVVLLVTPYGLGFADWGAAQWVLTLFGLGAILYSIFTDFEVGLVRVIPMPLHLVADGLGGVLLAASPWLFGFADRVYLPHLLFGLFATVASLTTVKQPADHAIRPARA